MRKKNFFTGIFLGLILIAFSSVAGNTGSKKGYIIPLGVDYEPNTVIVKLKPEVSNARIQRNSFDKTLSSIKAKSFTRKFPDKLPLNKSSQTDKRIDLSLVYDLEFDPSIGIEEVINRLLEDNSVQYAEPKLINKPLYTPNDPAIGSQYYLSLLKLYEAWDITKGDTNVVIGITDTGFELTHDDIKGAIKYNYKDPIDGIDNDHDGYVDNFMGWDMGKNDNDPSYESQDHGVYVSGLAIATADNGIGMAGPAFKCKFLPIKIESGGVLKHEFDGIIYAADHGCQIINCSWGHVGGGSQYEQDIISYATINKNSLVVAASGNNNNEGSFYPASYEYVISVAASDSKDRKGTWATSGGPAGSNYGYNIDVCAPGVDVYATRKGNGYFANANGTSFASPIAAGCAALIKSKFPKYSALQVGERLRATCDFIDTVKGNEAFVAKLGRGRINMKRALTEVTPSIRMTPIYATDGHGDNFLAGDTISLWGNLVNYLDPASNLKVSISTTSPYITIINGTRTIGAVDSSFDMAGVPFKMKVASNIPFYQTVLFKITYTDGNYIDYQYFEAVLNPDYISLNVNNVSTTVTSTGRIGYKLPAQVSGKGFTYNGSAQMLYAGGFMLGGAGGKVLDNVYGNPASVTEEDFGAVQQVHAILPSVISDRDLEGSFNDSPGGANKLGVTVKHKAFAWNSAKDKDYVIMEYTIKNTSGLKLDSIYAGLYLDWDINISDKNHANFDTTLKMSYSYSTMSPLYGGAKLLTPGPVNSFAIDNPGSPGPIGIYDGFTKKEKSFGLKNNKYTAGASGSGNDVSNLISSGPFFINSGDSVKVAFALIGGSSLSGINAAAKAADAKYNKPVITAGKSSICQNDSVVLTSSSAKAYLWNTGAKTRSITVKAAGTYVVSTLNSTDQYVSSDPLILKSSKVSISADGPLTFCKGGSVNIKSPAGVSYKWSNGSAAQTIKVTSQGIYFVKVKDVSGCTTTSDSLTVTIDSPPTASINITGSVSFCSGDSVKLTSSSGKSYLWSSGATSQTIYVKKAGIYSVMVTGANNCSATSANTTLTSKTPPAAVISANGPLTFCSDKNVSLLSTVGKSYTWSNGSTSQGITTNVSGNYTVTVMGTNGCSAKSAPVTVTSNPVPSKPSVIQTGASLSSSVKESLYEWTLNDTVISGETGQSTQISKFGKYKVKAISKEGCFSVSDQLNVISLAVDNINSMAFYLHQNVPNPFSDITKIEIDLSKKTVIELSVFNSMGQKVRNIVDTSLEPGSYSFDVDLSEFHNGIYYYRVVANGASVVKSMVLLRK